MNEEQIAAKGLNTIGFNGKWKAAQELATKNERSDDNHLLPYWERVRLLFLELGGEYECPNSPNGHSNTRGIGTFGVYQCRHCHREMEE